MKIAKIETFPVPPRWLFLRMETDQGLVGWGEPIVEGRARTMAAAVEELGAALIGKDPARIEDHWQALHRGGFYRGGPILMSAIAGIDQALWDIKGKHLGAPVYQLLGGACRDTIRVYSWIGGDRPADVAAAARARAAQGFTAAKMNATEEMQIVDSASKIDAMVERLGAVRAAVGKDFDIALDFHGRVSKPMAKGLARALGEFRPLFIEEPVLPENNEALAEIARHTDIPIATGERMFSRWDFKRVLADGHVDIIQPDLSHAGGITECKKIAAMAEAYDVALAPHCPLGPIAFASCVHLDMTCHNAFIQEMSVGIHYNQGADLLTYLKNPDVFRHERGFLAPPPGPGLGVEIDEEKVREAAKQGHDWKNPLWRHPDGSVAEW